MKQRSFDGPGDLHLQVDAVEQGLKELNERLRSLLVAILAAIRLILSICRGILARDSVTFYL